MPKAPVISLIEDDRFVRDSMKRLMRSLGYGVETFSSAADFLASSQLAETACLIADIQMPEISGIELHRRLVDAGRAVPTILVTAYPDDEAHIQALRDGVVGYLSKPVDEKRLVECLRDALRRSEAHEENS